MFWRSTGQLAECVDRMKPEGVPLAPMSTARHTSTVRAVLCGFVSRRYLTHFTILPLTVVCTDTGGEASFVDWLLQSHSLDLLAFSSSGGTDASSPVALLTSQKVRAEEGAYHGADNCNWNRRAAGRATMSC